jgi:uncharacterized protein YndB with AHSA1/START domain
MSSSVSNNFDYTRELRYDAPAERVFDALTTLDGIAGWWTANATGTPTTGGTIELRFKGLDEKIPMRVEQASRPTTVVCTCLLHTGHPEWQGTTIFFELLQDEPKIGPAHVPPHRPDPGAHLLSDVRERLGPLPLEPPSTLRGTAKATHSDPTGNKGQADHSCCHSQAL